MPVPLQTDRLRLDPWRAEHVDVLAAWAAQPAVVRHVGDGSTWSRERAEQRSVAMLEHWRQHDFGWRIAVTREDERPVGLLALDFCPPGTRGVATTEHEIGWWLDPTAWGRGYAREGAAALLDEAFGRLGAPTVIARIQPANAPSVAVAEAIGMRFAFETIADPGVTASIYRAAAPS